MKTRKHTPAELRELNQAIERMQKENPKKLSRIMNKVLKEVGIL